MPDIYRIYSGDSLESYKLLHHYLTGTSHQDDVVHVQIPKLGFIYPFLLDFIHCFSALHLARLQPQRENHYHAVADRFGSTGLRGLAAALHDIDMNNCQAVYAGSVFVCFNILGRGPLPGEYLLFSERGPSMWFQLLKGVRSILERVGSSMVFSGPLQGPSSGHQQTYQPMAVAYGLPRLDWIGHFQRLRDHIECSDDFNAAVDVEALDSLWLCFKATWGGMDGTYQGDVKNQLAFIWIYHLKDEFVGRLQGLRPVSLIIFSYFALLLGTLEHIWFISRWPRHIIRGIYSLLDDSHRSWLQWVLEAINQLVEN